MLVCKSVNILVCKSDSLLVCESAIFLQNSFCLPTETVCCFVLPDACGMPICHTRLDNSVMILCIKTWGAIQIFLLQTLKAN